MAFGGFGGDRAALTAIGEEPVRIIEHEICFSSAGRHTLTQDSSRELVPKTLSCLFFSLSLGLFVAIKVLRRRHLRSFGMIIYRRGHTHGETGVRSINWTHGDSPIEKKLKKKTELKNDVAHSRTKAAMRRAGWEIRDHMTWTLWNSDHCMLFTSLSLLIPEIMVCSAHCYPMGISRFLFLE